MILLNGKETAAAVKKEIAAKVAEMVSRGERPPHLVAVLVGDNGASKTYVANKEKACAEVGFKSTPRRSCLFRFRNSTRTTAWTDLSSSCLCPST